MGKKVTYLLDDDVVFQVKQAAETYGFHSISSFVETALKEKISGLRQEHIRSQILQASSDPAYLKDVQEISDAFAVTDQEIPDLKNE